MKKVVQSANNDVNAIHSDSIFDLAGKRQWAVVSALVDDGQCQKLQDNSTQSRQSQVVGGSQLHQKPTIKERTRAYIQAQTNSLHLDLIELGCCVAKAFGTLNGEQTSCFIVRNDNQILSNEEWQEHIKQLAKKYNHIAFFTNK